MTVRAVPGRLPGRGAEVRTVAAGDWFDAVRVPLDLGLATLHLLGDESGAVIRDGFGSILYWLIAPGAAAGWGLERVSVLGRGHHVAVPPLHRTTGPGLYWQVPPTRGLECTSAPRLHAALHAALHDEDRQVPAS
ncbi:hypothetical protein [Streptomyces sp. NPDC047000]|uniref:hypothetical protein n=1 Tax=Streptomyces sp. NPDC047000 TaxID=3155474 RepID=UPI0033DF28D1